jgi:hypothetical protein
MTTTPFYHTYFFNVGSWAGFLQISPKPPPLRGGGGVSDVSGVDTYGLLTGRFHRLGKGDSHDSPANLFGRLHRDRNVAST